MAGYLREPSFGYFLTPSSLDVGQTIELARLAEDLAFDLIGIQDHPYQSKFLDTWTLISFIVAKTERVTVFPDVANLPLRPPAVLAKSVASLDLLSGGRVELGLGTGAFPRGSSAMGAPSPTGREAVDALEEAIQVIRSMWRAGTVARFRGRHYSLTGAHAGPAPAHNAGIWIGTSARARRLLDVVGRRGDGWIPSATYVPPDKLPVLNARIDDAAAAAGRDPSSIRRLYNVFGQIAEGPVQGFLRGPVQLWVNTLTELCIDYGMDSFIFGTDAEPRSQMRLFAEEVVPQVRKNVARHRAL
jgi:alkanesulfonate monooxygenase SsuD/methylene tetrahydromethanopterin reductase-like flavin-dependent oxidoreductase (luciferase family)